MATRRRRRRASARRSFAPRRRRRRAAVRTMAHNPPRRRRRRRVLSHNPRRHVARRRRAHRNPGGIMGTVQRGVVNGVKVVAGQVVVRKVSGAVNAILPASMQASAVGGIVSRALVATGAAVAVRKFAPKHAEMVTAGAFAEVINYALAQNASTAKFLSAYPVRPVAIVARGGARRPALPAGGRVAAYPRSVGMPVMVGM